MKPKTFIALAVGATASVIAAAAVLGVQPRYEDPAGKGEAIFPGLIERASDVAAVTVRQAGNRLTFERTAQGWTLAESDGYPVHDNVIARTILGVAELKYLEPKTRRKDRLTLLDLGDPTAKGAKAKLLELAAADGGSLARIVVGKYNYSMPEVLTGGLYVRKNDSDQAWLALGAMELGVEPRDWLKREITDLKPERVQSVSVRQADGETLVYVADATAKHGFRLDDLPPSKKLKNEYLVRSVGGLLEGLLLNDVRRADSVQLDAAQAIGADFTLKDGLHIGLSLWDAKPRNWLSVKVRYDGEPSSAVADEAAEIAARTKGWLYDIPDYTAAHLRKRFDNITEDKKSDS